MSRPERSPGPAPGGAAAAAESGGARAMAAELWPVLLRTVALAAALVVVLWFLYEVRWAMLVLLLAFIGAVFLNAPVSALERRGVSRGLGTLIVVATLLAVTALLGWLILPRLAREVPGFIETLPQVMTSLADRASAALGDSPEIQRQFSMAVAWVLDSIRGLWQHATTVAGAVLGAIVVFALILFMLLDPRPLLSAYMRLLPERWRDPAVRAFTRSARMVTGWVAANVIIGGIRGVVAFLFLQWMGIPGAVLWGILSMVTALIPRVGFYIMVIPPVLVAAADSLEIAAWTAAFFIVFDEILGNFVVPRVQGETMQLHPAYILGFTVLMAVSFGVVGVLLAAPVAGILQAHVEEFYLAGQPEDARTDSRIDEMLGHGD